MSDGMEKLSDVIRSEILRQYREDERSKWPAGAADYEDHQMPWLIARAAFAASVEMMLETEPSEEMKRIWWNNGGPKPPWRAMLEQFACEHGLSAALAGGPEGK